MLTLFNRKKINKHLLWITKIDLQENKLATKALDILNKHSIKIARIYCIVHLVLVYYSPLHISLLVKMTKVNTYCYESHCCL